MQRKMKRKRAKKNSDHRQGVSQSVFASPFFFFFFFFVLSRLLRLSFFFLFSFVFCLPLNLSIDTIALCLFQIYIISAAIKILTSIYYIKLSVFFIFFHYMKSFNLSFNPTEAVHITLLIIFHYLINNSIIYFKHKFKYN